MVLASSRRRSERSIVGGGDGDEWFGSKGGGEGGGSWPVRSLVGTVPPVEDLRRRVTKMLGPDEVVHERERRLLCYPRL